MIYVVSPYSHDDRKIMEKRFFITEYTTHLLMLDGKPVFSPIVHCHEMAKKYDMPTDFEFWEEYCIGVLSSAKEVIVLKMDGWKTSKGVTAEIKYAEEHNIPITYMGA